MHLCSCTAAAERITGRKLSKYPWKRFDTFNRTSLLPVACEILAMIIIAHVWNRSDKVEFTDESKTSPRYFCFAMKSKKIFQCIIYMLYYKYLSMHNMHSRVSAVMMSYCYMQLLLKNLHCAVELD